ncbi:MAG: alpha/beta hydrolase [bacterium]
MQQILIINGGTTFNRDSDYIKYLENLYIDKARLLPKIDWKLTLNERLGVSYEVLVPRMPNTTNAHYSEWKLYFEAVIKTLDDDLLLIGHSLGGIFLAKYLSENKLSKKIRALFLLAAPFTEESESLGDFKIEGSLEKIDDQVDEIFILHSKDDPVVPISDSDIYVDLLPKANLVIFEDKGHFNTEEFSGLVYLIKEL